MGVEAMKARLGGNIAESMGASGPAGGAGGPLPPSRGVPGRYQGVARPKDVLLIPVEQIHPDPHQPRTEFDPEALGQLAASLKARGQLQPIRVRWDEESQRWTIVLGERRWRAAKMAGIAELACVETKAEASREDRLEDQLVENCVRQDLSPVEQGRAFKALMDAKGYSQRQLAEVLHVSRMLVGRALALLELPAEVQMKVEQGSLAPTTAVELAKLKDPALQVRVAAAAEGENLKRDEVAELVQAVKAKRPQPAPRPTPWSVEVEAGCVVQVRWRRPGPDLVRALKLALKLAHEEQQRGAEEAAA